VTSIGWLVTALIQKKILDRQLKADLEKEIRQVTVPRRIKSLDEINEWFQEGTNLRSEMVLNLGKDTNGGIIVNLNDDILNRFEKWEIKCMNEIIFKSAQFDELGDVRDPEKALSMIVLAYSLKIEDFIKNEQDNWEQSLQTILDLEARATNIMDHLTKKIASGAV
jgi:hypothetical protein